MGKTKSPIKNHHLNFLHCWLGPPTNLFQASAHWAKVDHSNTACPTCSTLVKCIVYFQLLKIIILNLNSSVLFAQMGIWHTAKIDNVCIITPFGIYGEI